jgi:hypothetical protein
VGESGLEDEIRLAGLTQAQAEPACAAVVGKVF